NVDLIQSLDRGRVSDPSDDRVRTTQLYAVASNDIFLDLTGRDRVPSSYSSRPNPFIVYVDHVQSTAGSVNLTLEDSIRQDEAPPDALVNVQVYDNAPNPPAATGLKPTYDGDHWGHFLPDPSGTAATLDPAGYANGWTVIASTYSFEGRLPPPVPTS